MAIPRGQGGFVRNGAIHLLDGRGWCGATLASIVSAAWMLPSWLDPALPIPALAAAKYGSWWITGGVPAGSLRRMDPEGLLFLVGNLAWMTCSAGMLYLDAPARRCVNWLHDDQRQTGIALGLLALALGCAALQQAVSPATTRAACPASPARSGSNPR